ncbi:phosphoribosyltransferase family protein [Desulfitobacterium sp. PCE1]|uniref:phosphoribosyltransferase family protein n=1 Tax=Desulfitobacterium sp. PCE1 TaxID=146907 RepID=UPI00035DDCBB|nr:phosphoribosyltransferase family protein [Desulfitobacterium sp. PCE1]
MNFVTFEDLNDCLYKNINKLPRDIDLIVGIPRSGLMIASLLALYLNLPFADIDSFIKDEIYKTGKTRKSNNWITQASEAKKILVVDDSISAGDAIKEAKEKLKDIIHTKEIIYCAIYALPSNFKAIDIYFEICNHPRMFEWNYLHHWGLEYTCVDIDGVLCQDPTLVQNDDGKNYLEFIKNAVPKFLPTKSIGYLVTSRLEKYRNETEEWLNKNGIKYKQLIMLDSKNAKERALNSSHAEFKASIYKKTDCFLFIESSYEQAVEIVKLTGKQVFCVENRKLIEPENVVNHIQIINRDLRITIKRVIKKILKKL